MYDHASIISVPEVTLLVEARMSESNRLKVGGMGPTLTCTVREAIPGLTNMPSAQWIKVVSEGSNISLSGTIMNNDTTAVTTLSFSPLKTSNAGQYICQGTLYSVAATNGIITNLTQPVSVNVICEYRAVLVVSIFFTIIVPTPNVTLSIPSGPLYEGTAQTLNCSATLPPSVDTDISVTIDWLSEGIVTFPVAQLQYHPFYSTLHFSPLTRSNTGPYSCRAKPRSLSPYITASSHGLSENRTLQIIGIVL